MGGAGCCDSDDGAFGASCDGCGVGVDHPAHRALEFAVASAGTHAGQGEFWRTASVLHLFGRSAAAMEDLPSPIEGAIVAGQAAGVLTPVFYPPSPDENETGLVSRPRRRTAITPRPQPSPPVPTVVGPGGGGGRPGNPPPDHSYADPADDEGDPPPPPPPPVKAAECCCNAVSLTLSHKKKGATNKKKGQVSSAVTVTWTVEIVGSKSATKIKPCTFEWWEIHNKMMGNVDDKRKQFIGGWWADLMKYGTWAVLDPVKAFFEKMACNTTKLSDSFTDEPEHTPGGMLTKKPMRWGVAILKSGCPGGPTKKRYWFSGMDGKKHIIWPPEVTPKGKTTPEAAPDVGDKEPPPFAGPRNDKEPKLFPRNPKYPKVPKGAS